MLNRNEIPDFGKRLKFLIGKENYKKRGISKIIAADMVEKGLIEPDNDQDKNDCIVNSAKTIRNHLKCQSCDSVSAKWIIVYMRYFKCSADFLLGKINAKNYKTADICKLTGLSQSAAGLLQEWNQDNPDWISNLDTLIKEPDFIKVLEYMSALKATAKFSADNYYRRKNFDKVNQALAERLTGYQTPEPDEITEKMNSTLVELARKSDIHEIGRIMENIMDIFYVKAIDKEYSRE